VSDRGDKRQYIEGLGEVPTSDAGATPAGPGEAVDAPGYAAATGAAATGDAATGDAATGDAVDAAGAAARPGEAVESGATPAPASAPARAPRRRPGVRVNVARLVIGLLFVGIGVWRLVNALDGGSTSTSSVPIVICPPGYISDGIGTQCTTTGAPPIDLPGTGGAGGVPSANPACPPGDSSDPTSPTYNVAC
jgi:hypothetical protein